MVTFGVNKKHVCKSASMKQRSKKTTMIHSIIIIAVSSQVFHFTLMIT